MGGGPSALVGYGFSDKGAIASLQAYLLFEYKASLFEEGAPENKRYYIFYAGEKRYVELFRGTEDNRLRKAVIQL